MFYTYKKMVKELTMAEIRTLIRGHNKMSQIKVPTGLDRDGLIKFLKSRKYKVDHVKKRLVDLTTGNSRGRITTLATAKDITKPKPKTDAQKQKALDSKAKKAEAKAKELKLAKKEGVKEFKQKKAEATKKPVQKKPTPKPVQKKPMKKEDEVRKARQPYPTIPPNVKGKRIPKGQLLLEDKKQGQVVKKPVKPVKVALKDKLIAKDKKAIADEKKAIQRRKDDKKPYKPSADSDLKEQMFKLNDYFVKDKNKIGNTFKTLKEVNDAIGKLFTSVKGGERGTDQLAGLDTSERKYFIKLLNNMLRFSTKERTGVEVTPRALQQYKGFYNPAAATEARETERKREAAPAQLEKKLLKTGSQLEDKPAIRAREKAEKEKAKAKAKAKEDKAKAKAKAKEEKAKPTGTFNVKNTKAAQVKSKPTAKQVVTFDYEEVSGYSDALKKALKQTYDKANSIVNKVLSLKPKDFVETEQKSSFLGEAFEPMNDDLNEDEDEIYDPIYDELSMDLDTKLKEIMMKNREETNWTKAKPALKPMQTKYIESMQQFKENNKPADFQAAKRQKDLILKHYKESDVPAVPNKEPKQKPKFKIDQSKQPKQTPSTKIDIKIKPDSNTKKIEPKAKEVKLDQRFLKELKSGTKQELEEDYKSYFEERQGDAESIKRLEKKTDAASKEQMNKLQMNVRILTRKMKATQEEIKSRPASKTSKKKEVKSEEKEKDLVYYIKNNKQPFTDLAMDIRMSDSKVFTAVAAGQWLQGQYESQGRSASTATRLINEDLKKNGFKLYFENPGEGGLSIYEKNKNRPELLKLFNEYRDKNNLTTAKAWKRILKLADKVK